MTPSFFCGFLAVDALRSLHRMRKKRFIDPFRSITHLRFFPAGAILNTEEKTAKKNSKNPHKAGECYQYFKQFYVDQLYFAMYNKV